MATLRIVGVRHHSPACARLVARVIDSCSPAMVLIEGPSDMNERIDELLLGHQLPIAVYSYRLDGDDAAHARGTWTPFCDYSPEWVALTRGRAAGAETLFIDLPAYDDAFHDCINRYADGLLSRVRWSEMAARYGFDCSDALWDHLFEAQGEDESSLEGRLARYFDGLRGSDESEDPATEMDARREAFMAQWIGWALNRVEERATVLVVCGGYHAPVLRRLSASLCPPEPPPCAPPEGARVGSFLVPFSFKRLDSFAGYASGMPSPAFYQAVWEREGGAPAHMLAHAVERLRHIGQVVSTADHTAASVMTEGLARMRGHLVPTRVDTLDGLVATLLKEPIDAPLPWSERQVLRPGTAPLLVELVAAYSGERRGLLAQGTPVPPLVDDAKSELAAVGLALGPVVRRVELGCADPTTQRARTILHRLRVLAIDGVELVGAPSLERTPHAAAWAERWALVEVDGTLPTLIERALYGATLAQAARACLEERMARAGDLLAFVATLQDALLASLPHLAASLSEATLTVVERESRLAHAGAALDALSVIDRRLQRDTANTTVAALRAAVFERALWLLEAAGDTTDTTFRREDIHAVRAIARCTLTAGAAEDCLERIASRRHAPPGLRGACLGALWSAQVMRGHAPAEVASGVCATIESAQLGDFLSGLAVTAREEMLASELLDTVEQRVHALEHEEFLVGLPSLRRAFAYFPPRERLEIARRVLARRGVVMDRTALLSSVHLDAHASRIEAGVMQLMRRFGLLEEA